jgi:hypothetical protein
MSKGKHGNKEAKKPKKAHPSGPALAPAGTIPTVAPLAREGQKKR